MLRIHTGLQKCIKKNIFDLHLNKMNPFVIHESCVKIRKNEIIFEQYRMSINRVKYDIEVQNYDAIKCNQILIYFVQLMFNRNHPDH